MALIVLKEAGKEARVLVAEVFFENQIWFLGPEICDPQRPDVGVLVYEQWEEIEPILEGAQAYLRLSNQRFLIRFILLPVSKLAEKLDGALVLPKLYFEPERTWWGQIRRVGLILLVRMIWFLKGKTDLVANDLERVCRDLLRDPELLNRWEEAPAF